MLKELVTDAEVASGGIQAARGHPVPEPVSPPVTPVPLTHPLSCPTVPCGQGHSNQPLP